MASTHMRARVQSPMLTTSETAPMVQKWVRWVMAPNTTANANEAHKTLAARLLISISVMSGLSCGFDGFVTVPADRVSRYTASGMHKRHDNPSFN